MPTKLKDIQCLVIDQGLFCELAVTLAKTYAKVYYYVPSETAFPKMNTAWIGRGLAGVEVVDSPFGDFFDDLDLVVFPDVNFGPMQLHMESLGKKVWGSRMGESMELDRDGMKQLMKARGLPVGGYKVVTGMDALREHLKAHKNQHVKISRFRGSFETFKAPDYKFVEPKLDEVEHSLGAFKNVVPFIVEQDLADKAEYGIDAYSIDGVLPKKLLSGIEIKDEGFVGVFKPYAELPEPITRFDKVMAPVLKGFGYRGFYSTEVRVGKDGVPYMIDFCARAASPPNELYQVLYKNLAEIIWEGANGNCIDPDPIAKYGAEALIHSSWADAHWQPIDIPDDVKNFVKLRNATNINGRFYTIPQAVGLPEIGAVIGYGDTLDAAIEMVTANSDKIKGYYLEAKTDSFTKAKEEIAKMEKFGLNVFR